MNSMSNTKTYYNKSFNLLVKKIIITTLILMGTYIVICGVISKINYDKKNEGYVETTAKIVNSVSKSETSKDKATGMISRYYVYAPVIEYKVKGENYRYELDSYDFKQPNIGQTIEIKYNLNDPMDIILKKNNYGIITASVGILFIIIGIIMIVINNKPKIKNIKENKEIELEKEENNEINQIENDEFEKETKEIITTLESKIEQEEIENLEDEIVEDIDNNTI